MSVTVSIQYGFAPIVNTGLFVTSQYGYAAINNQGLFVTQSYGYIALWIPPARPKGFMNWCP